MVSLNVNHRGEEQLTIHLFSRCEASERLQAGADIYNRHMLTGSMGRASLRLGRIMHELPTEQVNTPMYHFIGKIEEAIAENGCKGLDIESCTFKRTKHQPAEFEHIPISGHVPVRNYDDETLMTIGENGSGGQIKLTEFYM